MKYFILAKQKWFDTQLKDCFGSNELPICAKAKQCDQIHTSVLPDWDTISVFYQKLKKLDISEKNETQFLSNVIS